MKTADLENPIFEVTFHSRQTYTDPFNDVELDVLFENDEGQQWRVPAFWSGGHRWTVRFRPAIAGEFAYRLECSDPANPELNGRETRVTIPPYTGENELWRHGSLRVNENGRHFEHADSTAFYWLGDTWWTGLSDRLSWEGFQRLSADRRTKGFTVVQIVAGLVPSNEELAPVDPGFCNEGGAVWDEHFTQINPKYFDYADRRILHLVDSGLVPAIVGAWSGVLGQMGVARMKQHWRYIIARYSGYPVFWVAGGEVFDPPAAVARRPKPAVPPTFSFDVELPGAWSEIARFIRATDPQGHPLSVHEQSPDDLPLQDEALTDFKLIQPSHFGWQSIGVEIAQLCSHHARTTVTKPIVTGEIGYEKLGNRHFEDFQRTAFWLSMLNGAAGHTYGALGTWEAYSAEKPLHRWLLSFLNWEEGMTMPGSYQIGLGAKLLRRYPWWRFTPHPEWVAPHGTTFFEPRNDAVNDFHLDLMKEWEVEPSGEWTARQGDFRLPYAAGIPSEVRFIYIPSIGLTTPRPPTIFSLEEGIRYRSYYWEPTTGTKIDLGVVQRPKSLKRIFLDDFDDNGDDLWIHCRGQPTRAQRKLLGAGDMLTVASVACEKNMIAAVSAVGATDAGLVLRYHDPDNYLAAVYSPSDRALYLRERKDGVDGDRVGAVSIEKLAGAIHLKAEARDHLASASVSDGERTYRTPIVDVNITNGGYAGLLHKDRTKQRFEHFELFESPALQDDGDLERRLYDAEGKYRGELTGAAMPLGPIRKFTYGYQGWSDYGRYKAILLDAYLPERLPTPGDWLLVLEATQTV